MPVITLIFIAYLSVPCVFVVLASEDRNKYVFRCASVAWCCTVIILAWLLAAAGQSKTIKREFTTPVVSVKLSDGSTIQRAFFLDDFGKVVELDLNEKFLRTITDGNIAVCQYENNYLGIDFRSAATFSEYEVVVKPD